MMNFSLSQDDSINYNYTDSISYTDEEYDSDSEEDTTSATFSYDPYERKFEDKFSSKSKYKSKEFDYNRKPKPPKKRPDLSIIAVLGEVLFYAMLAALLILVIYIIIKIINGIRIKNAIKQTQVQSHTIENIENQENINENNYPKLIEQAEAQQNYRLAYRYHFLWILQMLSNRKLIIWQKKKTNQEYSEELKSTAHKEKFGQLSYIFDYVWYGEFSLSHWQYEQAKLWCNEFKKSL